MEIIELRIGDYFITTDKDKMDSIAIHDFLSNHSTWSQNISLDKVEKAINNSLNFGVFYQNTQIGFARVISDFATIAYLGDIYILENHRGKGLSKKLMEVIMNHQSLQDLRRWILLTSTAEWLYQKYGFTKLPKPEIYMELFNSNVYKS